MKKAGVHLFTSSVKVNNNQPSSVINEQLEQIRAQEEVNASLIRKLSKLNEGSTSLTALLADQKSECDRRENKAKHNRLYLKQVINHMAYTIEQYETQLKKQNKLIENMNNQLMEQKIYFEKTTREAESKIGKQSAHLRNISRKQSHYFEEILNGMQKSKEKEKKLFDNQEMIKMRHEQLEKVIKTQYYEQSDELVEIKSVLHQLLKAHTSIHALLSSLPPNYPVKKLLVNGEIVVLTRFLFVNKSTEVAYFAFESELISIPVHKIEAIFWGV